MKGVPPVKTFKAGAVRASVFENQQQAEGRSFVTHRVAVDRSYRDRDGNWQTTNSYSGLEIAKAILVLQKAFEFVTMTALDAGPPSPSASPSVPNTQPREELLGE